MGLAVVLGTQGPQISVNCWQEGSHTPSLTASLHRPGHLGWQGPQISVKASQEGSHWPDLAASWHLAGQTGAGVVMGGGGTYTGKHSPQMSM